MQPCFGAGWQTGDSRIVLIVSAAFAHPGNGLPMYHARNRESTHSRSSPQGI